MSFDLPVEERSIDNARPSQALAFLALQIFSDCNFRREDWDSRFDSILCRVGAKFTGHESLDARLDGKVNVLLTLIYVAQRRKVNDSVLTFEGGQDLILGLRLLHGEDLGVGRESGRGADTGEDADCVMGTVLLKGIEDAGAKVSSGLYAC